VRPSSSVATAIKGHKATVFLDKLGERLAFERMGTRLYEALINKVEAHPADNAGISVLELRRIHNQELAHFKMLRRTIEALGGDPTVQTPSADIQSVASLGLVQVITDPRTTPEQCLNAILIAELADHDGWQILIDLAQGMGQDQAATEFRSALAEETEHLTKVRGWLVTETEREAGANETIGA